MSSAEKGTGCKWIPCQGKRASKILCFILGISFKALCASLSRHLPLAVLLRSSLFNTGMKQKESCVLGGGKFRCRRHSILDQGRWLQCERDFECWEPLKLKGWALSDKGGQGGGTAKWDGVVVEGAGG